MSLSRQMSSKSHALSLFSESFIIISNFNFFFFFSYLERRNCCLWNRCELQKPRIRLLSWLSRWKPRCRRCKQDENRAAWHLGSWLFLSIVRTLTHYRRSSGTAQYNNDFEAWVTDAEIDIFPDEEEEAYLAVYGCIARDISWHGKGDDWEHLVLNSFPFLSSTSAQSPTL